MVKRSDHENKESHKKRGSSRIKKRESLEECDFTDWLVFEMTHNDVGDLVS